MTTLRRIMSEDEYYFFSSYHESWLASRPCFSDVVAPERLRIVFGHYCHETLLRVFGERPIFLFTGLREPMDCFVSHFRQINAIRAMGGRGFLSASAFLAGNRNPICAEILRAFPSMDVGEAPAWRKALSALGLFDFVYATEDFEKHVKILFDVLDIKDVTTSRDNLSEAREWPAGYRHRLKDECLEVRASARHAIGDDLRLWQHMRPYLGHAWMRDGIGHESWVPDRSAFVNLLPDCGIAKQAFCDRERDFMVHEFDELNRLGDLRRTLESRIRTARATLDRLDQYGAP